MDFFEVCCRGWVQFRLKLRVVITLGSKMLNLNVLQHCILVESACRNSVMESLLHGKLTLKPLPLWSAHRVSVV